MTQFAEGPAPQPRRRRLPVWIGLAAIIVVLMTSLVVRRGVDPDVVRAADDGERTTTTDEVTSTVSVPGSDPSTTAPDETTVTTEPDPTTSSGPAAPAPTGAPTVPRGPGAPGPNPGPPAGGMPSGGAAKVRLASVRSWAFPLAGLGSGRTDAQIAAALKGTDLVVIDGVDASPGLVRLLQAQGSLVLGYLDVGAIEDGRPWTAAAQPYKTEYWPEWDEWFADVSNPGYRRLVTGTMAPPILAKGFDGLFLDAVDMVEQFPQHSAGMVQLVSELSAMTRGRGGLLFMQNGDSVIDRFLPHIDGWNREDVSYTYDWGNDSYVATSRQDREYALATLRRLKAAGLFVSSVDYLASPTTANAAAARQSACATGAVPTVGDIGLTQLPPPMSC